jgi:glycine C-acetyltransferase
VREHFYPHLRESLETIRADGFYKTERVIASPQGAEIRLENGQKFLNFCANNYLGLANDARLIEAAARGLADDGFGMASVRFICGTQSIHKELESELSRFLGVEDTILYSSCFDANGGLFETLFGEEDTIISDELNHASIIDGIRLCKAKRLRYRNNDMVDLEMRLREAQASQSRFTLIATDGVFSMDGIIADLGSICELAERYGALVMVDDSHAIGFIGETGRGTPEHCGVMGRIDLITGTLGKALGGASGGYVAARREVIEMLRQRSRPYLFSNTLAPSIAAATLEVLKLLDSGEGQALRSRVRDNGQTFRTKMADLGFDLVAGHHPIIPVLIGDARLAGEMASRLLQEGVYVVAFSYPVVPKGKARIRTQMSAAHTRAEIDQAVAAFARVGAALGVLPAAPHTTSG